MGSTVPDGAVPRPPALQEPPPAAFWDEAQWAVFMSLMDAIVPSIVSSSAVTDTAVQIRLPDAKYAETLAAVQSTAAEVPDRESLTAFLAEKPSDYPAFRASLMRTASGLATSQVQQLGTALKILSTRAGALALTGYCTPINLQPVHVRETIVKGWFASWLPSIRFLAKTLTTLGQVTYAQTSPLFARVIGYPDVPRDWKAGPDFPYSFLQLPASSGPPTTLETDVVIVGSGCGGAVAAKVLAEAGHRVLVVDKGYYFPPSALPMPQEAAQRYLFDNGGFYSSLTGAINAVAGSCWGGGGTVNWSVSLQTQGYVRREWAEDRGLPFFATQAFQDCLDRVCEFMGVGTEGLRQSHRGGVLLEGSRRLGWHAAPLPQNSGGSEHYCGHCHLGCGSGDKQGPAVSWLPAAARAGAEFMEGFQVEKVLFKKKAGARKATGVVGRWTSRDASGGVSGPLDQRVIRDVVIKAKKVIVACGSMWSPIVLLKSGVKNRHIGMNLHLHPCNMAGGFYKEDIRPWEGGIITSYCSSFENLDGKGHGTKVECTCMIPYTIMANLPWRSGLDFKLAGARYRHFGAFISLTRDRDSGRVVPDPVTGRPCLEYTPSAFDRAHTLEGVLATCKMLYVTGADEIRAFLPGVEPFVRGETATTVAAATPAAGATAEGGSRKTGAAQEVEGAERLDLGASDPAFSAWLARVRKVGNASPDTPFSSAHQMSTCRMSRRQADGVVDGRGRVWGTDGLFVADASVFPSASGVNPMVTVMAIADWIARGVSRDLDAGRL